LAGKHVLDCRFREYQAFEQRIRGQSIGTVQAGAGSFAGDVEAGHVGAPVEVADDAAAGVMSGWYDRDRVAGDVDAEFEAAGVDIREMRPNEILAFMADVEIDAVQPAFFHFEVDGAGDDVARCQFGPLVVIEHETAAVGQAQQAAFAAHRF